MARITKPDPATALQVPSGVVEIPRPSGLVMGSSPRKPRKGEIKPNPKGEGVSLELRNPTVQYGPGYFFTAPKLILREAGLPLQLRMLWLIINDYAGDNRLAFPSHKALAKDMGKSVSTIKEYLAELEEKGWLRSEPRMGTSNFYWCIVPGIYGEIFDPSTGYMPNVVKSEGYPGPLELE
ncbi:helix-turn-helix domain-containing protein [Streptacidiphilus sp. PAMC 29251]